MVQQKRSIIDHTTTCPHCGIRCLHENLDQHIRSQHPGEHENDNTVSEMVTPGLNKCPYCQKEYAISQLYDHISKVHPEHKEMAENRVALKERERARRKRAR